MSTLGAFASCRLKYCSMTQAWHMQDGYALGEGAGEGEHAVAFEANAGSQQASLESGQVAYIATGSMQRKGSSSLSEGSMSFAALHASLPGLQPINQGAFCKPFDGSRHA